MNDYDSQSVKKELMLIREAIIKSGGDPAKQLLGYMLSEDPIYIPITDNARSIIRRLERDDILTELINEYFK
jgi:uncharacterized protein (UPF0297 family)